LSIHFFYPVFYKCKLLSNPQPKLALFSFFHKFLAFFFYIQTFFYTIMNLFITLLENVNKSRTSANNVSLNHTHHALAHTKHHREGCSDLENKTVCQFESAMLCGERYPHLNALGFICWILTVKLSFDRFLIWPDISLACWRIKRKTHTPGVFEAWCVVCVCCLVGHLSSSCVLWVSWAVQRTSGQYWSFTEVYKVVR
jgi:hypothetical protein